MSEKKKLIVRALMGGVIAKLLLLGFWIWFHLTGLTPQGVVPVGDFNLVSRATVAMFGSYWLAAAAEFACAFALGAAIGIASMPFADDTRSLLKESVLHFIITGGLVLLNLWVQCLLGLSRFFLASYALLYLLIWLGRWVGWYVEVDQIKIKLGLAPAHSPLKWRETLPYLPFLLVLCVLLPMVLVWADLLLFAYGSPLLSHGLMPYVIFPVVSLCSGISLGKRQGLCILYPVAAYLLHAPMVFWLFNHYFYLIFADILFTFALIGNVIGTVHRKRKQKKEVAK
ncbi:MAG: DUF3021 family protein [Oscillospiraceae bacterium]|nr:DUF3021 family protein [Oscillospiraceae bacterium]